MSRAPSCIRILLCLACWGLAKSGRAEEPAHLRAPQASATDLLIPEPEAQNSAVTAQARPHRWGLGINYTGAQLRYSRNRRWMWEGRYQQGKASSDYGRVTAQVFGFRGYRNFWGRRGWPLYAGSELAYVTAKTNSSAYATKGFAAGAFGGVEYYVGKRLSVNADIGPYVITLREKQTDLTQTTLDFVLNTALVVHLF